MAVSTRTQLLELGPRYGALLALLFLVAGNALLTRNFATTANLWNVLLQISTIALAAMGMTLVLSTGGVDLSVGSTMAVASVIIVTLLPYGAFFAGAAGLAVALAIGAVNGALAAYFDVPPFLVTLALMIAGRGVAQLVSDGNPLTATESAAFEFLGRGRVGPVPAPVLMMAVVFFSTVFAVRATSFGRYILAIGGNEAAARLSGVPVQATKVAVYCASALCAGLAGLIDAARLSASDPGNVGVNMEFEAIAAAVMGGTSLRGGRAFVGGTLIGALILAVINTSFNMQMVPFAWSLVFKAALILGAVYVQRPRVS